MQLHSFTKGAWVVTENGVAIYGLVDPRSGQIRYVGQTTMRLEERLDSHMNAAQQRIGPAAKTIWLMELREAGLRPSVELLTTAQAGNADLVEAAVIEALLSIGHDLLNVYHGRATWERKRAEMIRVHEERTRPLSVHISMDASDIAWARQQPGGLAVTVRRALEIGMREDRDA